MLCFAACLFKASMQPQSLFLVHNMYLSCAAAHCVAPSALNAPAFPSLWWQIWRPNQESNFTSHCAQVVGFVPTGWMYEMKKSDFPVRKKASCQVRFRV